MQALPEQLPLFRHDQGRLVTPAQRDLFWERLHLVDMIATDHAPHTLDEKRLASSARRARPGDDGTAAAGRCRVGRLSYERFVELVHAAPLRVYGLRAPEDSEVLVDLSAGRYLLPGAGYQTRCGWSPFEGLRAWAGCSPCGCAGARLGPMGSCSPHREAAGRWRA